jgi:hypothetical protein
MANLKALREKIKNITDYSPDLQQYNDQLDELINDAYFYIWNHKRWTWATKEYYFKFIPDMLPSRDTTAAGSPPPDVTASVIKGSRQVTFSQFMDRLTRIDFEGQPIEIQNYEYTISKVVDTQTILLDKVFHGTTNAADVSWRIKKRYYDLPQDCIELLSLAHRDAPNTNSGTGRFPPYGKLIALMPRRDEQINLRMDYAASYAEAFVWSPSFYVPEAFKVGLSSESIESNGFPANTHLEVCWAFMRDGHVGALSEPQTIQFGAQGTFNLSIDFLSWDDQPVVADTFQTKDTQPSQFEGLQKIVFWNSNFNRATGERLGLPVWRAFNNPGGSATRNTSTYLDSVKGEDTDSSVTISAFNQIDPGNKTYIEYDGQYNRIRPYPRVDAWDEAVAQAAPTNDYSKVPTDFLREAVARYYYKPEALGFSTDSPQMPYEVHQLIVYKVLETLYDKVGSISNADNYRRRFEKEVKDLQKRYVDHIDSMVVRGQFQIGAKNRLFVYDYASLKTGG